MKTLNQLKNQFGEILSREELKNVIGGVAPGTRCVIYCCDHSGNCTGEGTPLPGVSSCSTHEECQGIATEEQGFYCDEGYYIAALCKG